MGGNLSRDHKVPSNSKQDNGFSSYFTKTIEPTEYVLKDPRTKLKIKVPKLDEIVESTLLKRRENISNARKSDLSSKSTQNSDSLVGSQLNRPAKFKNMQLYKPRYSKGVRRLIF